MTHMAKEPVTKRAVCFFDGQNLFHSVKQAFGYTYPNYDVSSLSDYVCVANDWKCVGKRFYTGVPDASDKPFWNHFWIAKGAQMGREGVKVFTRSLKYRNKEVRLPDGRTHAFLDGDEKGIDVRLAIDVIRLAHKNEYDVAVVFSRDQDLSEVADEIRTIAVDQQRWIRIASAYPYSPAVKAFRGINNTQWIKIERAAYDACIDTRDYRPKPPSVKP
jgi:uncharacterized LabA/DUF88 family protein